MAQVRVRRSRHLVSYWTGGELVFVNYATNTSCRGNALVVHVLDLCGEWTPVSTLLKQVTAMPPRAVRILVRAMVDAALLVRSDTPEDPREKALASWDAWNPAAGFFHFTTKNVPPPA